MQKPFDDGLDICERCGEIIHAYDLVSVDYKAKKRYHADCRPLSDDTRQFNEPEHYHKHKVDTIRFLQEGFPQEVFMAFALGNVVKYAQRANYKNGREDLAKMVDYAKRALDWYDKTHS